MAEKIRDWRNVRVLSIAQLAETLGIMAAIEGGRGDIHLDLIGALADAFSVTPYELFSQGTVGKTTEAVAPGAD